MKIAFATDFHLGYSQYGISEREEDFYTQYDLLIDEIIKEEVDVFIELGDIFDSPKPNPFAMKRFKDGLQKLKNNNIRRLGIIGNHTMVQRKNYYPIDLIFDDLEIIDNDFLILDNLWIGGVTYKSRARKKTIKQAIDMLYDSAKDYPVKVLLLHQGLEDVGIGFDFTYEDLEIERFDFIFLGHIHKRMESKYKNTTIHYVGSLNSCNTLELTDELENGKGYTLFDTETLQIQTKSLPPIRYYLEYNITDDEFNDEWINETIKLLKQYPTKPIVQLNIESDDAKRVYERVDLLQDYCISIRHKLLPTKSQKEEIEMNFPNGKLPPVEVMIKKALNEKYKEEWVGDFAVELMKRVSNGNKKGAKELADDMYNQHFKRRIDK